MITVTIPVPTNVLTLALSLGLFLPAMADPQLPAKPLSPPPVTASSSSAANNAPLSLDSSASGQISFVGGTAILTKEGHKSAENIIAGDRVWATDLTTHKSGYHAITHVSLRMANDLIQLLTDSREKIETTPASLFWVNTKGWVEARSLFPGEQLLQRDGTFVHVFNVIPIHAPETKVYSFEVEDFHTYYVGKNGLLVHNAMPKLTTD